MYKYEINQDKFTCTKVYSYLVKLLWSTSTFEKSTSIHFRIYDFIKIKNSFTSSNITSAWPLQLESKTYKLHITFLQVEHMCTPITFVTMLMTCHK